MAEYTLNKPGESKLNLWISYFYQTFKKLGTFVSIVLCVLIFILLLKFDVIRITYKLTDKSDLKSIQICESKECLVTAAELQSSLDTTVDPCEDFYQYACGGWIKKNVIPPHKQRWNQMDAADKNLLNNLRVILDGQLNNTYPPIIGKTIKFYEQCLDSRQRDLDGIKDLKELVTRLQWPMINQGNLSHDYDWINSYAQLNRDYGFNFILSNKIIPDLFNTTVYSLLVSKEGSGSEQPINPKKNSDNIIAEYKSFIKDSVLQFCDDYKELDKSIDDMILFERRLVTISNQASNYTNDSEISAINIDYLYDFVVHFPDIPLLDIEQQVFDEVPGANITLNTTLYATDIAYFKLLNQELSKTDNKTIANYLSWKAVQFLGVHTSKAMRDIKFKFSKAVSGVEEQKPLWEECVESVNAHLMFAVARLYTDRYFPENIDKDINEILYHLNISFKQLLENQNHWMERETKDKTLIKINEMIRSIGFPQFLKNDELLENYYENFSVYESESYFKYVSAARKWSVHKKLKKLDTCDNTRKQLEWIHEPISVGAFFYHTLNQIGIALGILQSPFYTNGIPISLNLGAIGYIIGHEITHAFVGPGRYRDQFGNAIIWWDDISESKYNEKTKCFKDQYNNYNDSLAGRPVNGLLTLDENIADNQGLRMAFRALENYNGSKKLLPASMSSFTTEQLFFLSFANVWCSNIRKETLISLLKLDVHSPGKYRVWGSVSNSESFAKAFKCKANSKMNPKSKCCLW